MTIETVYATSHIAGTFSTPTNAVGLTTGTWAGALNTSTSATSRWAIGDPVDPLTASATQTIAVQARKGSNSGTPTIALNLYENGTLVRQIGTTTNVTSTTGQSVTGTFTSSEITDRTAVEIEVVMTAAGGSPSVRNSAQVDYIQWTADTSAAVSHSGGSGTTVTITSSGGGVRGQSGGSAVDVTASATGGGARTSTGGAASLVTVSPSGAGVKHSSGGATASLTFTPVGAGSRSTSSGSGAALLVAAAGGGTAATAASGGSSVATLISPLGAGVKHSTGGSAATLTTTVTGGGVAQEPGGGEGGAPSSLTATATGAGVKHARGGSAAFAYCRVHGAGWKADQGDGSATVVIAAEGLEAASVPLGAVLVRSLRTRYAATVRQRHGATGLRSRTTATVRRSR